jgi:formamidopyrimidine-DNA glycosylase
MWQPGAMVGTKKRQFCAKWPMPELPEVETVRRGLAPVLVGATIARVEARRGNLRFPLPERFGERLKGVSVTALERRAKYLIAHLSSGDALVMHLGMTGRFTIASPEGAVTPGAYVYQTGADAKHDHVVFHLSGGARIVYNDPRRFGFMVMIPKVELSTHPLFRYLGSEPLSEALTPADLAWRSLGKKVNLKSLLMDQRVVAGLGNIYVSEALFRAGLSPLRPAKSLTGRSGVPTERTGRLVVAIKAVLGDAIAAGGSTLKDYRHADGAAGQFQESFKVYDRAGEACQRTGCSGTVRRLVQTGRASFYCPKCQT